VEHEELVDVDWHSGLHGDSLREWGESGADAGEEDAGGERGNRADKERLP
jgi:hypothetical protein